MDSSSDRFTIYIHPVIDLLGYVDISGHLKICLNISGYGIISRKKDQNKLEYFRIDQGVAATFISVYVSFLVKNLFVPNKRARLGALGYKRVKIGFRKEFNQCTG